MAQYKTPDVYVVEKSTMPPSVAEVPTAIPAFIGYTATTKDTRGEDITQIPRRITSMVEYERIFGGKYLENFTVKQIDDSDEFVLPTVGNKALATFYLHQALGHFFANGGGTCYVISIGGYDTDSKNKEDFISAIDKLNKVDEVTLIACPESIHLNDIDHYTVQDKALAHSGKRKDRFALVDVRIDMQKNRGMRDDAAALRTGAVSDLKYGAAYYPYLRTSISRSYDETKVTVSYRLNEQQVHNDYTQYKNLENETVDKYGKKDNKVYAAYLSVGEKIVDAQGYVVDKTGLRLDEEPYGIFTNKEGDKYLNVNGQETTKDSNMVSDENKGITHSIPVVAKKYIASLNYLNNPMGRLSSTAVYNKVKVLLNTNYLVLPPSAAIAGVIAKTDAERGVWKAPANVALAMVVEPTIAIDSSEQEDLNVDVTAGKSINAIRSFIGKGTLVWGARTLAGNDNEWRYVPVRRLFNMVEESIQKSTAFAVFEPNTPFTWLKVKTMIESYLENIWQQGALFGTSPEQAFFVNVGLGQTMTEDDINNGYMKIDIGLAAVRPAEFIVLTFTHKSLEG